MIIANTYKAPLKGVSIGAVKRLKNILDKAHKVIYSFKKFLKYNIRKHIITLQYRVIPQKYRPTYRI